MNILFLTLANINSIHEKMIYTDLLREFAQNGHKVLIVSASEKRNNKKTYIINEDLCTILKIRIGNVQKTKLIEKGISTLTLESKFKSGIQEYFSCIKFDLVLYTTPPITLQEAVEYVKRRDNAKTYLLLKDIFPQNALDLGLLKNTGVKSLIYKYFKKKEKKLYNQSDYIGCMSQANVKFLLKHNPDIPVDIVEVCPNSIEPLPIKKDNIQAIEIKSKYRIPLDKTIFIYGGNLGKPQGIDFMIECLKTNIDNDQVYFIIVGSGTEFNKLKNYFDFNKPINAQLHNQLPNNDYEVLVNACDVGLIFLDKRFTIPNFPSRLLSYMQASIPVLAATDVNTDIGEVITNGKFGLWCESCDVKEFNKKVQQLCNPEIRKKMGINARQYLEKHYTAKHSYEIILKHFKD